MLRISFLICYVPLIMLAGCQTTTHSPHALEGLYKRDDGASLVISGRDGETLRYRIVETGETGAMWNVGGRWTSGDGWAERVPVNVTIEAANVTQPVSLRMTKASKDWLAKRVDLDVRFAFTAGTTGKIYAKLVLPKSPGPHPLVVVVHGSEKISAVNVFADDRVLASRGMATLIFDKRGTGRSEGTYTQNFAELAADVVAAAKWASSQPGIDSSRVGLLGYSQGGWVAPIAANQLKGVVAVGIGYGLLMSPLEEEVAQALAPLNAPEFTDRDRGEAEALVRAGVIAIATGEEKSYDSLGSMLETFRTRPWASKLGHGAVRDMFNKPLWLVKIDARFFSSNTSWMHDGRKEVAELNAPIFWQIAADDREAPPAITIARLAELSNAGKPIEVKIYDGADHGLMTYRVKDGKREVYQFHPDAMKDMADWLARKFSVTSR